MVGRYVCMYVCSCLLMYVLAHFLVLQDKTTSILSMTNFADNYATII
jgi:hypothetical protein